MRVVAKVPPGELVLEEQLALDRLRRQRIVSLIFLALCAAGAVWYYAVYTDWPSPTRSPDGTTVSFELTWAGWLQATWIGAVIVIVGLVNLVRVVRLTRAMHRLRAGD